MSSKGSSLMKSAQNEKTKQAIQLLVEWYASKEEFYKVYLPIQETIVKRIFTASEITLNRLKDFSQYFAEQKEAQALAFQKNEKSVISDESKYQPKTEESNDPKNTKASKVGLQMPVWCSNIDRVLISLSRNQKERQAALKKTHKLLDTIQESLVKEEAKYKGELKKFEKQLDSTFGKIDEVEKEESKIFAKILKEAKNEDLKESSHFIGEIKKMEKLITQQLQLFARRGKSIVEMIQVILKLEKDVSKKIKDELINYRNSKQNQFGSELKGQQDIWGQVALLQEKIEVERVTYFNRMLLRPQRIQDIKKIINKLQAKNNWQIIVAFLSATKEQFSQIIQAQKSIVLVFKTISYRCWSDIAIAQGWLIESYTPSVMYMTYDSIMLIYNKEGQCLKKIHTSSSKVSKVQGSVVYLTQKVKGFFSDSIEEYKIRFKQLQRLQEFQLFIENQIN